MSARTSESREVCVIGAGASGLVAARALQRRGIPFRLLERDADVGGTWNPDGESCRVYDSARLITSKRLIQLSELPMPEEWPDFIDARQALTYLKGYAHRFNLWEHTELDTTVASVTPGPDGSWEVVTDAGDRARFRGVVVATGHLQTPYLPLWRGTFTGRVVHAARYRDPEPLRGRRVLVVGAGNAGCDIAVDAARTADQTFLSSRHGYVCLPKTFAGRPVDHLEEALLDLHFPSVATRLLDLIIWKLTVGSLTRDVAYENDQGLKLRNLAEFEDRLVFNDALPGLLRAGSIVAKPDLDRFDGDVVHFVDGTYEAVDAVVLATGYKVAFPFLEPALTRMAASAQLGHHIFAPGHPGIFFIGLAHTNGGSWQMAEQQSELMAAYLTAVGRGAAGANWRIFAGARDEATAADDHAASIRQRLEVERRAYRRRLERLTRQLDREASRVEPFRIRRPAVPDDLQARTLRP